MTTSVGDCDEVEKESLDAIEYALAALDIGELDERTISRQRRADLYTEMQQNTIALFRKDVIFRELVGQCIRRGDAQWFNHKSAEDLQPMKALFRPCSFTKTVKKIWKKHKVPILIGTGIVAGIAGAVIIASVCTASAAAAAANNNPPNPGEKPPTAPPPQTSPPPQPVLTTPTFTPLPVIPPMSSFLANTNIASDGLWIDHRFYPYMSDLKGADYQYIRSLPADFRQNLAIHSIQNIASSNPAWVTETPAWMSKTPVTSNQELVSSFVNRAMPATLQKYAQISALTERSHYPLWACRGVKNVDLPNAQPSWMGNALALIGRGIIDNPDLLDPNAPLLPEPNVGAHPISETLELIGQGIIDSPFLFDPDAPLPVKPPTSSNMSVIGALPDYFRIGGINGMNTQEEEKNSHMAYIAGFAPNASMDWVYNHSNGVVLDVAEIFTLNYAGISPNTGEFLLQNWTAFHEKYKDQPGVKYLQFCHSQGAIHLLNELEKAPKEIRDRVIVIAIAPAAVVPKELCYKSFNYACKTDIVPYGQIVAGILGRTSLIEAIQARRQLILLDAPPNSSGINHDFQNPVFKEVIQHQIDAYLQENGNYK